MKKNLKIVVVMPAYNASRTLEKTYRDIPKDAVSEILLVDDNSTDDTINIAKRLDIIILRHSQNMGYGGNQKTCYKEALKRKADIVIMIHPDYQYDATLTNDLIKPIIDGRFDIMFGSRIRTRSEALSGGMPVVKYYLNRAVSLIENIILGVNFTEHMSGFRAYSRKVLKTLPINKFSNDFVFDQQFMISAIAQGFRISEYPVPIRYFSESSSIKFLSGIKYILETFLALFLYIAFKLKLYKARIFV